MTTPERHPLRPHFTLPENHGLDETESAMFYELLDKLLAESSTVPHFGTAQAMLIERTAYMYTNVRHRERGEIDPRIQKELNTQVVELIKTLMAQARQYADFESMKAFITEKVFNAVTEALEADDPVRARELQERLAESFARHNL